MSAVSWRNTDATDRKWCCICKHSGAALSPAPGANQQDIKHFLSLPVPVLSPGRRVQSGMEVEDAEQQDYMYTVSVRSGFFP